MDAPSGSLQAVLTRPLGRSAALSTSLEQLGWQVTECPALDISPVTLSRGQALPLPASYDLVIFVSVPAIEAYHQHLMAHDLTSPWPDTTRIGCVGQASALMIRRMFGNHVSLFHPADNATQDSEALWAALAPMCTSLKRVLIVRGQDGRDWLASCLTGQGIAVDFHVAYCRKAATWTAAQVATFRQWEQSGIYPVWLLTSSHGIEATLDQFARYALLQWASHCRFILTHPRQEALFRSGFDARLHAAQGGHSSCGLSLIVSGPDQQAILSSFEHFRDNKSIA